MSGVDTLLISPFESTLCARRLIWPTLSARCRNSGMASLWALQRSDFLFQCGRETLRKTPAPGAAAGRGYRDEWCSRRGTICVATPESNRSNVAIASCCYLPEICYWRVAITLRLSLARHWQHYQIIGEATSSVAWSASRAHSRPMCVGSGSFLTSNAT